MLDLNDVYYFAKAVETGGISAAARALNQPKSSISRRIIELEAALGARLIQRTTRSFNVTELGREFHRHALAMLVEAEAAESAVRERLAEPSGAIRFSCSVALAQLALAELIPQFMARYPRVDIVQHAVNRYVDPVHEGFDLCLRAHTAPLSDSSLVQRPLATIPWHLFAGPAYIKRRGLPKNPAQLAAHEGILLSGPWDAQAWRLKREKGAKEEVTVPFAPRLQSDDMATLKMAACAGLGIVALPGYVCRAELAGGLLERVLPQWTAGIATVSLVMPSRRGLLPSIRAFSDFLAAQLPPLVA